MTHTINVIPVAELLAMKEAPLNTEAVTLAVGDRVAFVPNLRSGTHVPSSMRGGGVGLVWSCDAHYSVIAYEINGCSWYYREDLILVQRATPESFWQALAEISNAEDDENEDIELDEDDEDVEFDEDAEEDDRSAK